MCINRVCVLSFLFCSLLSGETTAARLCSHGFVLRSVYGMNFTIPHSSSDCTPHRLVSSLQDLDLPLATQRSLPILCMNTPSTVIDPFYLHGLFPGRTFCIFSPCCVWDQMAIGLDPHQCIGCRIKARCIIKSMMPPDQA